MEEISTVGIDLAKPVFQIHAIDGAGKVVIRRQLRRQQMLKFFEQLAPCRIGMEACGTAHYWARTFGLWARRAAYAAGLCKTLCQATEERCRGRRGDL